MVFFLALFHVSFGFLIFFVYFLLRTNPWRSTIVILTFISLNESLTNEQEVILDYWVARKVMVTCKTHMLRLATSSMLHCLENQ
jgi:hypothetical protein